MILLGQTISRRMRVAAIACAAGIWLTPAFASETITYAYDTRGRLVKVSHSGAVNNGVTACYGYDKADNRSNVTVATAADCSAAAGGVSFSISSNGPVAEGANSVFTITKTGTATTSLSVNYATSNLTAVAPGDYTAKATTTLTFTTAQTSQTVSVTTIDDTAVESAETFQMSLSAPTGGATLGTATATATINASDGGGGGPGGGGGGCYTDPSGQVICQ
jgi:chitinase